MATNIRCAKCGFPAPDDIHERPEALGEEPWECGMCDDEEHPYKDFREGDDSDDDDEGSDDPGNFDGGYGPGSYFQHAMNKDD
jgi:hypothetical protein